MTRVRIAPPDTEEDVSAEQVVAYARCACGHRKNSHRGATNRGSCKATIHTYGAHDCPCSRFLDATSRKGLAALAEQTERARRNIERDDEVVDIARAEQRYPSAVLADIVGPAKTASVGVRCGDGPSRCYYARRYRPCTTDDITAAVVAAWPNIAAAVGYVGNDPFPIVDGWMGVGFSVRLFGSGKREGAANQVAARVAMDALMVSLARVGFAVSHNGNEWQKGRLILGWADSAAHGAGESEAE